MLDWKQEENNLWFCYKDNQKIKGWIQDEKGLYYHLNDKDGELDTGFFQTATDEDFWFYAYKEQIKDSNGNIIHVMGECATGWIQDNKSNGDWYYLYPEKTTNYGIEYPQCSMAIDWVKLGDKQKWYYLLKEKTEYNSNTHYKGACVCNTTLEINGQNYTFDSNGVLQTGSVSGDSLVSEDCISFVKGYEQFYSYKYDDGTGTITQGYGCIGDEIADWGDEITEQQASDRLNELINSNYAKPLKEYLDEKGVSLTIPQFNSLVSCAYNIGVSSLEGSSLMKYIISGGRDASTIQNYFCMWSKATINGVSTTMNGLYKRRVAESNIFNYGTYDSTH